MRGLDMVVVDARQSARGGGESVQGASMDDLYYRVSRGAGGHGIGACLADDVGLSDHFSIPRHGVLCVCART